MKSQLKPIEIGYEEDKIIIFPRMVSVAEENVYTQKFTDIADSDEMKYQKEFEICREFLGEYSAEIPVKVIVEKGEPKRIPIIEDAESATDALAKFFSDRSPENERVVRDAYFLFKQQLAPDARFL